ncbi:PilZ domain-containing protein [Novosphingobium cyanobacteriorum]|uniref:PilZ domain-containing protein n=1 Tax=Novosphingobium cyanobacteriorum TaxID=3024215 RepID=A0ABT6CL80_9SPHN|nr:PilZ domain-containing protein [Novosphingobium cyanobacteriorum]MDF8333840.1 PilZ domain-containing protein [Novosphingobium cyanobacteriorum]
MATAIISGRHGSAERRSERNRLGVRIKYRRRIVRLAAQTIDLSCHGLRLSGMERFRVGDTVWITLPGLEPRRANVVWAERFQAGCEFAEPLHPAVLEAVVRGRLI